MEQDIDGKAVAIDGDRDHAHCGVAVVEGFLVDDCLFDGPQKRAFAGGGMAGPCPIFEQPGISLVDLVKGREKLQLDARDSPGAARRRGDSAIAQGKKLVSEGKWRPG